jgi:L-rhamnose mutarotase
MKSKISCAAFHEAGYALACLLVSKKFKYVTIKPEGAASGYVQQKKSKNLSMDFDSIMDPASFNKFFIEDFLKISGFIAQKMYEGKGDFKGAKSDDSKIMDSTLHGLSERFISNYSIFLVEYTFAVFSKEINWLRITAIAESLIKKEILSYADAINLAHNAMQTRF